MKPNVGWLITAAGIIIALLLIFAWPAHADGAPPAIQQQIDELKKKVQTLEGASKKQGLVKWSGYIQGRYQTHQSSETGTSVVDDFHLRRVRLSLGAKPSNEVSAKVSADFAKGTVELKDAFITWVPGGDAKEAPRISFGQMNWPFGREVPTSSSVRECPERALWSRKLFEGERDLGFKMASVSGSSPKLELGVYNGTGINKRDNNQAKDIVGRLGLVSSDRAQVGVSGYWGRAFVPAGSRTWVKNRYGADLKLVASESLTLTAEGAYARDRGRNPWGWLAQAALKSGPRTTFVARFDEYESDGLDMTGRTRTWNAGIVQNLAGNLKGKVFWQNPKSSHHDKRDDSVIFEMLASF